MRSAYAVKTALSLVALAVVTSAAVVDIPAMATDITGKVVAVYHEPVTVNNKVMDKVSVTVANCKANNQFVTAHYSPSWISDENHMGHLFRYLAMSARHTEIRNQFMNMVNGHVTLAVDANNTIQKTTFWGNNWACGQNIGGGKAANMSINMGGGNASNNAAMPANTASPSANPSAGAAVSVPGVVNTLRRFGF